MGISQPSWLNLSFPLHEKTIQCSNYAPGRRWSMCALFFRCPEGAGAQQQSHLGTLAVADMALENRLQFMTSCTGVLIKSY